MVDRTEVPAAYRHVRLSETGWQRRLASSNIVEVGRVDSVTLELLFPPPALCPWDGSKELWVTLPGAVKVSMVVDGGPVLYESFVSLRGGFEHARTDDEQPTPELLAAAIRAASLRCAARSCIANASRSASARHRITVL